MRKWTRLATMAVTAAMVGAAAAATTAAASADPAGYGPGAVQNFCIPAPRASTCLTARVQTFASSNLLAASATVLQRTPPRHGVSSLRRLQITSVQLVNNLGVVEDTSGPVNVAATSTALATTGFDTSTQSCAVRHRAVLNWSARLSNGNLDTGIVQGPWVDGSAPTCAGSDVHQNDFVSCPTASRAPRSCLDTRLTAMTSRDGTLLYAKVSASDDLPVGYRSAIRSVQIDSVTVTDSHSRIVANTVLASNSGTQAHPVAAEAETFGTRWRVDCTQTYHIHGEISVRMVTGDLYRFNVNGTGFITPGCSN